MPNNAIIGTLGGIYDPAQIVVTLTVKGAMPNSPTPSVHGGTLSGFGENIITLERVSEQADSYSGADGQVVQFYTNDRRGRYQIELEPTSLSLAIMSSIANADETAGAVHFSLSVKDNNGNDVLTASDSWVRKRPRVVYRKGIEVRVFECECANLVMNLVGQGTMQ